MQQYIYTVIALNFNKIQQRSNVILGTCLKRAGWFSKGYCERECKISTVWWVFPINRHYPQCTLALLLFHEGAESLSVHFPRPYLKSFIMTLYRTGSEMTQSSSGCASLCNTNKTITFNYIDLNGSERIEVDRRPALTEPDRWKADYITHHAPD